MRRVIWSRISATIVVMLASSAGNAATAASEERPVSFEEQDKVIAVIGRQIVRPETARWIFDFIRPAPGGGDIICGKLDYQDSTKKYEGLHRFFATYSRGKVGQVAVESKDPSRNRSLDIDFAALCDRK